MFLAGVGVFFLVIWRDQNLVSDILLYEHLPWVFGIIALCFIIFLLVDYAVWATQEEVRQKKQYIDWKLTDMLAEEDLKELFSQKIYSVWVDDFMSTLPVAIPILASLLISWYVIYTNDIIPITTDAFFSGFIEEFNAADPIYAAGLVTNVAYQE